jgi:hypothetical protein
MRRQWIAVILLVIAVLLAAFAASRACNDDDDDGGTVASGSGTPTPTPETITEATREVENIEVTVETDKQEYGAGEDIPATAVVTNNRGSDITYTPVVPGEAAFRMEALSLIPLGTAPLEPVGDAPPAEGTIEPGGELKLEVLWDQVLDIPQTPVTAPPGRYSIRATFIASGEGLDEPVEIEVAVTFRIEGTDPVLTPLEALTHAIQNDELVQWMEGRATNVVCASPSTGFFYQAFAPNRTAAETFDFLYTSQAEAGQPICGIVTDGNAWRLNFFSEKGGPPHRINLLLNLGDGSLIRIEEPTPAPSETPSAPP